LQPVIKGRTQAKDKGEKKAEEDIRTQQEVAEGWRKQCGGWGMRQHRRQKMQTGFWSENL
jgi:hypothetical protein